MKFKVEVEVDTKCVDGVVVGGDTDGGETGASTAHSFYSSFI